MLTRAPAGVRIAQVLMLVPGMFFGRNLTEGGQASPFFFIYAGAISGGFGLIELLSWFRGTWFRMMVLVLTMGVSGLAILVYFPVAIVLLPVAVIVVSVYLGPGARDAYRRDSDPF